IMTSNDTDIMHIIDLVKRKNIRIQFMEKERNYSDNRMTVRFTIQLFHRGVTDKLSHTLVKDLEKSGIPLYLIKWRH
ncbi:MAG: hypothetical protein JW827_04810, partial [Spirochaetes bacterium]|nr:hypothetical protein [Spirochaetota bacterium]